MGYLRKIAREPSTAAGMAVLSIVLGQYAGPDALQAASPLVAALAGLWAVFKPESGGR